MAKLADYLEVQRLLDDLAAREAALMPNEIEMLHSLKAKYETPTAPDPFDVTALAVMLRNIEVRKGYKFDPRTDGGRVITLPRTGGDDKP